VGLIDAGVGSWTHFGHSQLLFGPQVEFFLALIALAITAYDRNITGVSQ
jgi:hypothetical protein